MTVQSTTSRADYTGNGTTTAFAVPFYFLDNSHVTVYRTVIATGATTTLVLGTDYTLTGAGISSGGTLTTTVAPTSAQKLSILRSVPSTQLIHYVPNDPFPAATHEMALDQLTMEVQQTQENLSRALVAPSSEGSTTMTLPPVSNRIGRYLAFDSNGNPTTAGALPTNLYLGAYTTAPTTRTDGTALQAGDLYFNVLTNLMFAYNGTTWNNYEANASAAATAAAASATAADASATIASASATSASASSASASASSASATSSATSASVSATSAATYASAAAVNGVIYPTTAAGISNGVVNTTGLVGGSGGTNGTFALAFSGGGGSNAAGVFVVSGGAVTQITITSKGYNYTSAPTISFAASSGLTGASVTAVIGALVPVGGYFSIPGALSSNYLDVYRVDAGPTATYINSTPAASLVNQLIGSYTVGLSNAASGTAVSNGVAIFYWPGSIQTYAQYLTTLQIPVSQATAITIVVAYLEADTTLTLISSYVVPVTTVGQNTISGLQIYVPPGCVVGSTATFGYYDATSVTMWNTTGVPTSHTTKSISATTNIHTQFTLVGATIYGAARGAAVDVTVGQTQSMGFADPIVTTGTALPSNYTYITKNAVVADGYITQVKIGMKSAGSIKIVVANVNSSNVITAVTLYSYTLPSGVNTITTNIPVSAGQNVGICSVSGGNYQGNANTEGVAGWYYVGVPAVSATLTASAVHRYEWRLTVKSGLTGTVQVLQNAAPGSGTGTNLLESADASGVTDATSYFTAARASHPAPYVRPGTFTVTSIPNKGQGFWGPPEAIVNVAGVRLALPSAPNVKGLWHGFRARLAAQINSGSPLIFIGDSISHWAYATTADNHYINLIEKWANLGIAVDEPLMTALRPSSTYVPSFYGVTTSGTVSTGTNGPISESIILAPGAAISFTGAYETIDVFYTQSATAGSLAFAYNAVNFKTFSCNGSTVLDQFSGITATGQTVSGAYTITNTHGTNSVEITGLVRLGVKSGTVPRLHVMRAAHGSYQFTNFGSAAVTSILKQATYAGGTAANSSVIIELGTNDSAAGLSYATIKSRAETLVGLLTSNGVLARNIFAIPVWRWSSYGATTYESADAALRDAYTGLGVTIIPADSIDMIQQGFSADGHPNDAGNAVLFNMVVQSLAGF